MMMTNKAALWAVRIFVRIVCAAMMLVIGVVQTVGTVLTAISAVILKGISSLMIFVTVLLLLFGLFTWTQTLIVFLIAVSMFWIPDILAAVVLGLFAVQAKCRDLMDV